MIDASGFGGRLTAGGRAASRLVSGSAPVADGTSGHFLYDSDDGRLSYDANGSTASWLTQIAVLNGAPGVTAADFLLVA